MYFVCKKNYLWKVPIDSCQQTLFVELQLGSWKHPNTASPTALGGERVVWSPFPVECSTSLMSLPPRTRSTEVVHSRKRIQSCAVATNSFQQATASQSQSFTTNFEVEINHPAHKLEDLQTISILFL